MSPRVPDPEIAARMRATAAELTAAGLDVRVQSTRGVLDITARLRQAGGGSVDVIVDDDGYVQISYWNAPDATSGQMVSVITAALAAIDATALGESGRAAGSAGR
jgi:hypothetical protein